MSLTLSSVIMHQSVCLASLYCLTAVETCNGYVCHMILFKLV